MKPDDILDARLGDDIRNVLLPGEQLLWEGRPLVVKKHKLFSLSFFKDFVNALYPIIGFVLIIFIWGFRHGYLYFSILILLVLVFASSVVFEAIKIKRIRYAISEQRAFFQLWKWGRKKLYIIHLEEVMQVTYQEFENKEGILYFFAMPNTAFNFTTYDLRSGEKRFHPTFEMVPNVIELQQLVSGLLGK